LKSEDEPHVTTGVFERLIALRAPAVRAWPGWFRNNFTPVAAYTLGGIIITAVVVCTEVITTARAERTSNTAIVAKLDAISAQVNTQSADLRVIYSNVTDLKKWKDEVEADWRKGAEIRNPYIGGGEQLQRELEWLRRHPRYHAPASTGGK
jgi:hypothetical protein